MRYQEFFHKVTDAEAAMALEGAIDDIIEGYITHVQTTADVICDEHAAGVYVIVPPYGTTYAQAGIDLPDGFGDAPMRGLIRQEIADLRESIHDAYDGVTVQAADDLLDLIAGLL